MILSDLPTLPDRLMGRRSFSSPSHTRRHMLKQPTRSASATVGPPENFLWLGYERPMGTSATKRAGVQESDIISLASLLFPFSIADFTRLPSSQPSKKASPFPLHTISSSMFSQAAIVLSGAALASAGAILPRQNSGSGGSVSVPGYSGNPNFDDKLTCLLPLTTRRLSPRPVPSVSRFSVRRLVTLVFNAQTAPQVSPTLLFEGGRPRHPPCSLAAVSPLVRGNASLTAPMCPY